MTSYTTLLLRRIQMRPSEGSLSRFCQGAHGHLALAQGSWHLIGPHRALQGTYRVGGNNRPPYGAPRGRVKSQTLPHGALLRSLVILSKLLQLFTSSSYIFFYSYIITRRLGSSRYTKQYSTSLYNIYLISNIRQQIKSIFLFSQFIQYFKYLQTFYIQSISLTIYFSQLLIITSSRSSLF